MDNKHQMLLPRAYVTELETKAVQLDEVMKDKPMVVLRTEMKQHKVLPVFLPNYTYEFINHDDILEKVAGEVTSPVIKKLKAEQRQLKSELKKAEAKHEVDAKIILELNRLVDVNVKSAVRYSKEANDLQLRSDKYVTMYGRAMGSVVVFVSSIICLIIYKMFN